MNILVCASCLPDKYENNLKDLSAAGNKYQLNLINSLRKIGNVKVLSFISINTDGKDNEILLDCKNNDIECVIANGKKKLQGIYSYRKKLKDSCKWADIVITYNVLYAWLGLPKILKYSKTKSIVIAADFTPWEEQQGLRRKIYSKFIEYDFKKYDKVVMLSEAIEQYLIASQERVIINGCIDYSQFKYITRNENKEKIILLYSGLLSEITGIDLLIESFKSLDRNDIHLIITGKGDMEEYVKENCEIDDRIVYKGFVSKEEYYKLLNDAHILVNPRNMKYMQNETNFPSKVLEYLASGKIILSTKFTGYKKYNDHMYFVESNSQDIARGIEQCIKYVYSYEEEVFSNNRKFSENLTWDKQITKFI